MFQVETDLNPEQFNQGREKHKAEACEGQLGHPASTFGLGHQADQEGSKPHQ